MSYIGKVAIDSGASVLVGSTLFGICDNTASATAKVINDLTNNTIGSNFDIALQGVTVHIKFTNGNTATTGVTLQVGGTTATDVIGDFTCAAGAVVAFTYEQAAGGNHWIVNTSHGELGTAAYTSSSDYATAAQGTKADNAMPKSGGEFTGPVTLSSDITSSSAALSLATKNYVDSKTAGLSGLTGAMHFKGRINGNAVPDASTSFNNYDSGDVILLGDKEYVYLKGADSANSEWILLGDEGSYALKDSTASVGSASNWNAGSATTLGDPISADDITAWDAGSTPTLGTDISADSIDSWDAGSAATASVTSGVLNLSMGSAPTLTHTAKTIPNVTSVGSIPSLSYTARTIPNVTSAGTAPTLTVTSTTVVVPNSSGGGE